jgi:hypothetical protein
MNYFVNWVDNVLSNPYEYVDEVLKTPFQDFKDGDKTFKNIQMRENDEFEKIAQSYFPDYKVNYNFIRQSPYKQKEPNYIHSDEMMGDKTLLLYLNKLYPKDAGTTLYQNDIPMCKLFYKFNRMVVFDSYILHSRNLYDNFGEYNNSRLIQVIFLQK